MNYDLPTLLEMNLCSFVNTDLIASFISGVVDDVVESCIYLSNYIKYEFRTYAPTPLYCGLLLTQSRLSMITSLLFSKPKFVLRLA